MGMGNDHQPTSRTTKYVTFALGDEAFALSVMQIKEVLRVSEIAPVPGAPGYVLGIINLRGNVVTIIDARRRFGLPVQDIDAASRILIIEHADQVIGIVVDSVTEVVELSAEQIEPAPNVGNDETAKYIVGVASPGDELLIIVDLRKLLSADEWQEVASF